MRCKKCQQSLSMWLDGELTAAVAEEVSGHVEGCPDCARSRDQLLALNARLEQLPGLEPSSGFDAAFARKLQDARRQQRLSAGQGKRRSFWRLPILAGAAATVCGAAVVALLIRSPALPDDPSAMELASHLELLQNYDVINHLDALENFELVEKLDSLVEADQ